MPSNPSGHASARDSIVAALREASDPVVLADMSQRYGIHTPNAMGVPMAQMKAIAEHVANDHALAVDLWAFGWYETRIVASLIDVPEDVTADQMDAWCHDFDNWAIVDTVCFNLFDRTEHAWSKVEQWASSDREFTKRAGFALLWSLALHDRTATDQCFADALALVGREAHDPRPLVNKAVIMAFRAIAKRKPALSTAVTAVAERLAASDDTASRRVGQAAVQIGRAHV